MKPGRELDALVAEKVMGISIQWDERNGEPYPPARPGANFSTHPIPRYSTDIAAAMEAAAAAKVFTNKCWYLWNDGERWCVGETNGVNDCCPHVNGESPAHALSLAALKAVGA